MGINGLGGAGQNGGMPPANTMPMTVGTVNAYQVQQTVYALLVAAGKQKMKLMINDIPMGGIRMGFSVEVFGHPYNCTIPTINRYPEEHEGYIDMNKNSTVLNGVLSSNITAMRNIHEFLKAFEQLEVMMVQQNMSQIDLYGVKVTRHQVGTEWRFAYELAPQYATLFKNDLKF